MRREKLGWMLDTLPERLVLARTVGVGHAESLKLVLGGGVTRRETPAPCCEPPEAKGVSSKRFTPAPEG